MLLVVKPFGYIYLSISIKLPECALKAHKLIRFPLADILDSKTLCRCAHRFVTRGYIDCSNTKSLPTLPTHQLTRFLICHRYRAVQEVVSFERAPRYIGCVDCSAHTWRESSRKLKSYMQTNMPQTQINLQVLVVCHNMPLTCNLTSAPSCLSVDHATHSNSAALGLSGHVLISHTTKVAFIQSHCVSYICQ